MKAKEGKISVDGHKVWYRCTEGEGIPLLTLHGGPGAGHDYLEPLDVPNPIVFYDQLGCGKSDIPDDTSLWRIERFAAEVDAVREALGLEQIHLLGQSWGVWLGIEYMVSRDPKGVVSLILSSGSASVAQFVSEAEVLKSQLPKDIYETMLRCEAARDYQNPDYLKAFEIFFAKHVCRRDPMPEPLARSAAILDGNPVYAFMNGPNEFMIIGTLKDWDRTSSLHEIKVPTLITCGRHDELTPACSETIHRGIAGSEMVIFEESSHVAHLEEPERFTKVLRDFLSKVERSR